MPRPKESDDIGASGDPRLVTAALLGLNELPWDRGDLQPGPPERTPEVKGNRRSHDSRGIECARPGCTRRITPAPRHYGTQPPLSPREWWCGLCRVQYPESRRGVSAEPAGGHGNRGGSGSARPGGAPSVPVALPHR